MLRILGYAGSINVRKVLWACAEIGIDFVREDWGGEHRSTSDRAFRALNPVGLVPVIDDDGVVVWESNVILRYLAASRGRSDLLPADPRRRCEVEMWMDWQASDLNNSWRAAFQGLIRKHPEHSAPDAIERSLRAVSRLVGILDQRLAAAGGFICGPRFSLADIPIGLSIHRWRALPTDPTAFANVAAYYDRLCERPGFRAYGRDGGP